jgi:hypothetical protein
VSSCRVSSCSNPTQSPRRGGELGFGTGAAGAWTMRSTTVMAVRPEVAARAWAHAVLRQPAEHHLGIGPRLRTTIGRQHQAHALAAARRRAPSASTSRAWSRPAMPGCWPNPVLRAVTPRPTGYRIGSIRAAHRCEFVGLVSRAGAFAMTAYQEQSWLPVSSRTRERLSRPARKLVGRIVTAGMQQVWAVLWTSCLGCAIPLSDGESDITWPEVLQCG